MRYTILAALLFVGTNAVSKEFVEKMTEEMEKIGEKCVEQEKPSADDIEELMQHKFPPTSHEAKCVLACFYDHYKIFNDDGTVNKQNAIDAFEPLKADDPDLYKKVLEIIDVCENHPKVFDDKCETASAIAVCVQKEAKARGIDRDNFM